MASMFWGLKMEPGKRYSTTVDKSFHISMATLDPQSVNAENEIVSVVLDEGGGGVFFLTNLRIRDQLFSNLDLNFMTGDKITLFCKGQGVVHLSGYMVPDEDDLSTTMLDDEAEEEEEEEVDDEEEDVAITKSIKGSMNVKKGAKNEVGTKRKPENEKNKKAAKKKKIEIMAGVNYDSEEDSEEDANDDLSALMGEDEEDSDDQVGDYDGVDDEDDDDEDDEEEEEEVKVAPKKPQKNQQKTETMPNLQQQKGKKGQKLSVSPNKTPNGVPSPQQKLAKKEEGKKSLDGNKTQQNQQQNKQSVETTLTGGIKVKDIRTGNGQVCKPGKNAVVYYTGRLKSNGKVFDSVLQGSGFKFKVGEGQVIKGWDVGIVGMKTGGKRIITCPPQAGYGQKGSPPQIPPNSTLVFEVELKHLN